MSIEATTPLGHFAVIVGHALREAGIRAVLSGGACAGIHSGGLHHSRDADFVLPSGVRETEVDRALQPIGLVRRGSRWKHPRAPWTVEFPAGPLAVGEDLAIRPIDLRIGRFTTLALSATDSCRDRLAAFYHWRDRSSLEVAIEIAFLRRVNMARIESWSRAERAGPAFEEFRHAVDARKRARRRGRR